MFKWGEYLSLNDDLVNTGISTYTSAIDHYNKHGRFEDRCMSLNESDAHSLIKGKLIKNFDCIDTIIYTNETKFSVIITHFNRQEQLFNTLNSLLTYVSKYNFEVIIVDDGSDIPLTKKLFLSYNFPINIINIPKKTKTWVNPCIAYNKGIRASTGDIIILQNAEIIHVGNIFETVINNLTPQNYVVFSVFNSPNFNSNILFASNSDEKIKNFVKNTDYSMFAFNGEYYVRKYGLTHLSHWEALKHWNTIGKSKGLKCNESGIYCDFKMAVKWKGWLSHPTHNDRGFHFLSAISRKKMFEVGGFDEDFSNGIDYDDDDFVIRLSKLVSEIRIINPNNVFGVHQFHQKCAYSDNIQHKLKQKNKIIFEKKCKENKIPNINYIGDEYVEKTGVNKYQVQLKEMNRFDDQNNTVSIIMAHNNKKSEILKILDNFEILYAGKYNFDVIIVDNNSDAINQLNDDNLKEYNFKINIIKIDNFQKNLNLSYKKGILNATGKLLLIQNVSCYHCENILENMLENINTTNMISYGYKLCTNDLTQNIIDNENNNNYNQCNNFCLGILKDKIDLINAFDDEYINFNMSVLNFILEVRHNVKLNIIIENNKYLQEIEKKTELYEDNKNDIELYEKIKNHHINNLFDYPKLMFLYWDMSRLSYLNYLTILSFNKYHKYWKIILFTPTVKQEIITWKGSEQKTKYTSTCYFENVREIKNVKINKVCLDNIGFYNDASEVIKSDYFRYYILEKHGGIWSDFDIMYIGSIEENNNFTENNIITQCENYFPVGFFMTKPKSKLFKHILDNCKTYYNKDNYQSLGVELFATLFHAETHYMALGEKEYSKKCYDDKISKIDNSTIICDNSLYLPYYWYEIDDIFCKTDYKNKIMKNTIGIHWFNGHPDVKNYLNNLENKIKNNLLNENILIEKHIQMYTPSVKIDNKFAIIIPFRNRYSCLKELLIRLKEYKENNNLDFDIYLINQSNNLLFNKGIINNIGFLEVNDKYNYVCFNDCDCLPVSFDDRFDKNSFKNGPVNIFTDVEHASHLASFKEQWNYLIPESKLKKGIECTHYDYLRTRSSSGSFMVNNNFYKEINGFANNYCGWGAEDCDFGYRIMHNRKKKIKNIINNIVDIIKNNFHNLDIIELKNIEELTNIEYSVYRYLLLIFENNLCENIEKNKLIDIINNDNNITLPGMLLNRRPGLFNASKHEAYSNDDESGAEKIIINPNYNTNLKQFKIWENYGINDMNEKIDNYILEDGLSNTSYDIIKKSIHCYNDVEFNVIDATFNDLHSNKYKKISIVMAYYNRKSQLLITLKSISMTSYNAALIEVIIVDDGSDEEYALDDIVNNYLFYIKVIKINKATKMHKCPCIPYNVGFGHCSGDIIIIQNPECMHIGDIISYTANNLTDKNYLTFSCFTTNSHETNDEINILADNKNSFVENIKNIITRDSGKYMIDWMGWLNHEKHNPCMLHFCSAITKNNLHKINGFDESYSMGHWYDDDEFLNRIKLICEAEIVPEIHPFVVHLFHKSAGIGGIDSGIGMGIEDINNNQLIQKNKLKFTELMDKIKNENGDYNWLNYNKDDAIKNLGKIFFKKYDNLFDFNLIDC